ncbi:hypothetical protein [Wohlfahrtiimonas larvae]|uniref:Uncharacterized protein n=1 Tax=Wohlfahrtiimonas larvae TaxID=1157986 RepID=A0ABP9MXG0_9GAMM|nr:hypothetical protein [Wohlfahrtiimonas larvae]
MSTSFEVWQSEKFILDAFWESRVIVHDGATTSPVNLILPDNVGG